MMRLYVIAIFALLLATGCGDSSDKSGENSQAQKDGEAVSPKTEIDKLKPDEVKKEVKQLSIVYGEDKSALQEYYNLPHIKEFYEWQNSDDLTESVLQYPEDLSTLSYEELRLLRNEVFARNGYLFNDGYLRGYFNCFKWYKPIFNVDGFQVTFNEQEKTLVDNIIAEESKRKQNLTAERNGLELLNADLVANTRQFENVPESILKSFDEQNFCIVDANRSMPFYAYDDNAYQYIPHYITTDLYLFILHKYFSRFIERLDEKVLSVQLNEMLRGAQNELNTLNSAQNSASIEWAKMYSSLALYAAGTKNVKAPAQYAEVFNKEAHAIDLVSGSPSFIENILVNYSELMPRGHYTKSDILKNYFKGFKWISINGIDISDDEQLKGMLTFAYAIKNNADLFKSYKKYVSTIEKLAGREDNVSLADVLKVIGSKSLDDLLEYSEVEAVRSELASLNKENIKAVLGDEKGGFNPPPKLYFLSSTYSISGDIFSKLIHIQGEKSKRPFPRGLDVPAVFGNQTAQSIIVDEYKDNDVWPDYLSKLEGLQSQFSSFSDWNHNYGSKGLHTALAATAEQENYPAFMKTDAYNRKELSTMLSSWTHIKHDLVLYQEKPFAAECGQGGGPEPPQHFSYVEPNIAFWQSAIDLVQWLEELSFEGSPFKDELQQIKDYGALLNTVAQKQLDGKVVTKEEHEQLHYIGGVIENILLGLLETDHIPDREKSMGLIADVYVYNGENLNVAVGHADDIYVLVPIKGEYYISRGSVFSYYEFTGEIHTDEKWREMLAKKQVPERPEWIAPFILKEQKLNGRMQFRYPGHGADR